MLTVPTNALTAHHSAGGNETPTIVHIASSIANEASGPSYSVRRLCVELLDQGHHVMLITLDSDGTTVAPTFVRTFELGLGPKKLGRSPTMARWLDSVARAGSIQVLHGHGLWMMPNVYPGRAVARNSIPYVHSPRGTMARWAMSSGSRMKRVFWPLVQKPALRSVICWHATSEPEHDDIRRLGFRQPVAVIPNAIDVPILPEKQFSGERTLLFLGRIHYQKGLDILVSAWHAIEHRHPEWTLVVAGPEADSYGARLRQRIGDLHLQRMKLLGPLYGKDKWDAYHRAELFVLPTFSENFGVAVAESLAAGTPAIVSKGAPWKELQDHQAGWWIDIGVDPLVAALEEALRLSPDQLRAMGQRGKDLMRSEYSWLSVGARMAQTYEWILGKGPKPEWIRA